MSWLDGVRFEAAGGVVSLTKVSSLHWFSQVGCQRSEGHSNRDQPMQIILAVEVS